MPPSMEAKQPAPCYASADWHAIDRDPVHQAPVSMIVIQRIVPGRAIVPHSYRSRLPLQAALELFLHANCIEIVEEDQAFVTGPAFEMRCER
jgi:hypothetical protein